MTNGPALPGLNNVVVSDDAFYDIHRFHSVTDNDIYPGIDPEFVARKGTDKLVKLTENIPAS
jgi:hypothetical protein